MKPQPEDPGSRECLEKHLKALEKAQKTCRERLEALDKAEAEEAEKAVE